MKKILTFICLFCLTSTSAFAVTVYTGQATVYRVIDGDTFIVNDKSQSDYSALRNFASKTEDGLKYFNNKYKSFRIRLSNTDTAESEHPDESRNSASGKKASDYTKSQLTGKSISYSCWDVGYFKRMICSVSLNGQDYGINLIENGYSVYYTKYGIHPFMHNEYKSVK